MASLSGKTVVFAGSFQACSTAEAKRKATDAGAKVGRGVTKTTDFLVTAVGAAASKVKQATDLGIEVLSEEDFLAAVDSSEGSPTYMELGGRFWSIEQDGHNVTVKHGKIGNKGTTQVKHFDDHMDAEAFVDKQVAQKRKAGYEDAGPAAEDEPPAKRTKTAKAAKAVKTTKGRGKAAAAAAEADDPGDEEVNLPEAAKQALGGQQSVVIGQVDEAVKLHDADVFDQASVMVGADGDPMHANLSLIDPAKSSDKYYIVQALSRTAPDAGGKGKRRKVAKGKSAPEECWVVLHWGRTGTAGNSLLHGPYNIESATEEFEEKFAEKTGNEWTNRANFTARAGKYSWLAGGNAAEDEDEGQWQYWVDDGVQGKTNGWYNYDEEGNSNVEHLQVEKTLNPRNPLLAVRFVASGDWTYRVDLNTMTQTNTSTGTQRVIRRVPPGEVGDDQPPTAAAKGKTKAKAKATTTAHNAASRKPAAVSSSAAAAAVASSSSTSSAGAGPAVDEHFPSTGGKVLFSGGEYYDAMLNQTNIAGNNNKYYKLQVVKVGARYFTFARWGRVGEPGQNMMKYQGNDEDDAIKEFKKVFKSKSANDWDSRDDFVPKAGKYQLVEVEHDQGAAAQQQQSRGRAASSTGACAPCALDGNTQGLVEFLFDKDMFQSAMAQLNIDTAKLPLGALSQAQIDRGYDALSELEDAINAGAGAAECARLTSQFYTVIPHNFGRKRPPVISTAQEVLTKYDMLNVLADIETAQAMQEEEDDARAAALPPHPTDINYGTLNADLTLVSPSSKEYKVIKTYSDNTMSSSGLELQHVWAVNRHNEDQRFAAHDSITNRKLLWHGTNVAVVAAIMKSGLRIMPHSGGRVGKGIYLASEHGKSSGYVGYGQNKAGETLGIMFLVEAALGQEHHITRDDWTLTKPPSGCECIIAKGQQEPQEDKETTLIFDGKEVVVPQGKPVKKSQYSSSSFYQSEYLIYKESQHRIRYMLTYKSSAKFGWWN